MTKQKNSTDKTGLPGPALSLHFADALGMMHIAILKLIKLTDCGNIEAGSEPVWVNLFGQCASGCLSGGAVDLPVFRCLKGD